MPDCLLWAPLKKIFGHTPSTFCTSLNQETNDSNLFKCSCCFQSLRHPTTSSCSVLHRLLTFPIAVSTQSFTGVLVRSSQKDLGKFYSATSSTHGQGSTPQRVRLSQMLLQVILMLYPQRCDQPLNQQKNGRVSWHNPVPRSNTGTKQQKSLVATIESPDQDAWVERVTKEICHDWRLVTEEHWT